MNCKDIKIGSGMLLKVLCYGGSGTGKTTFAGSFPKCLFCDFDNGMLSLRGRDIEYESFVEKNPNRPTAFKLFEERLNSLRTALAGGHLPFKTVVIDSLTTMQESIMRDIQLTTRTIGKMPTLQEWGILVDKMADVLYQITSLNCNLIVTAHEQIIQDELTSEVVVLPLIVGKKLPDRIGLFFDEVYHFRVDRGVNGKPVYQVMTVAERKYKAKSRLRCFDVIESDFSYDKMLAKINRNAEAGSQSTTPTATH